jgi:hypothetical protein
MHALDTRGLPVEKHEQWQFLVALGADDEEKPLSVECMHSLDRHALDNGASPVEGPKRYLYRYLPRPAHLCAVAAAVRC